jgi:hypothetical protein
MAAALDDRRPVAPEAVGIDMNGLLNASRVMARLRTGKKGNGRRTSWTSEWQHLGRDGSPMHQRSAPNPSLCGS